MTVRPAIALLEFDSIARGILAGDAMIKRAPLDVLRAGSVEPGKYLVLVGGLTADVEEAIDAGRAIGDDSLINLVYLPDVHPDVVAAVAGQRRTDDGEALGVIETRSVAATIDAADAGVKGARVSIRDLRLADDLGGKAYVLFGGVVAEVEAAVGYGLSRIAGSGQTVGQAVIARLHDGMRENLVADPRFGSRASDMAKAAEPFPAAGRPAARANRPMPGSGTSTTRSEATAPGGASGATRPSMGRAKA